MVTRKSALVYLEITRCSSGTSNIYIQSKGPNGPALNKCREEHNNATGVTWTSHIPVYALTRGRASHRNHEESQLSWGEVHQVVRQVVYRQLITWGLVQHHLTDVSCEHREAVLVFQRAW